MDIKDSYLHGTVGVVKSISVSADKLKYTLADIAGTVREVTLPVATQTANGLMSSADKTKLDNLSTTLGNYVTLNTDQDITGIKTFTKQLKFTVAKGTAPFLVTSNTKVTNLNTDQLDGYDANAFYNLYGGEQINASETNLIDLNNYKTPGTYYINTNKQTAFVSNLPVLGLAGILVINQPTGTSLYFRQQFTVYSGVLSYQRIYYVNDNIWTDWVLCITDLDTYNAVSADKLKTKRKLWGLDFDGSADVNGDMYINNNVSIHFKDSNGTSKQALGFTTNNTLLLGHGMGQSGYDTAIRGTNIYIQYGSSNSNAIAVKSTGNVGIGNTGPSEKLEVSGNVKATSFIGNLDGTYVNKLTGYSKATSAAALAATDTLNAALGKLEYKADTAYSWYRTITEDDTDDIINKWDEVVDFVNGLDVDLTDEFVTRKTDQIITGTKTFASRLTLSNGIDYKIVLNNTQAEESKILGISFQQDGVLYGALHTRGSNDILWNNHKIWHDGNDGSGSGLDADFLAGFNLSSSHTPWGTIPLIRTDGVTELGICIDFHYDNTTGSDYSTRLLASGNYSNRILLPTTSGTLALTTSDISGNAATASALKNAVTLTIGDTGKSFNGSAGVSWTSSEIGYRHEWQANILCATWSRLCHVKLSESVCGSSYIIQIQATRGYVVYNKTYLVTAHHGGSRGNVVQLGGCDYSQIKVRVTASDGGDSYFEIYDDAWTATSSTSEGVKCSLTPLRCGAITKYTTFTSGEVLDSGYKSSIELTSKSYYNSIQASHFVGDLIGNVTGSVTGNIIGNADTATKLKNPVKLWGNDFDGSADVNGNITLPNGYTLLSKDSTGNARLMVALNAANEFHLGYGTAKPGYPTLIHGNNILFYYGTSDVLGMILKSGYLGIGTSDPYSKLHVYNGQITIEAKNDVDTRTPGNLRGPNLKLIASDNGYLQSGGEILFYNGSNMQAVIRTHYTLWFAEGSKMFGSLCFYTKDITTETLKERMRIHHTGSIGVNVSNPQAQLHVNGSFLITSGDLRIRTLTSGSVDPGDIVFENSEGVELMRIFKATTADKCFLRFGSSAVEKELIHSGNLLENILKIDGHGSGIDADTLDGKHVNTSATGGTYGKIPYISDANGVMEIGRYIDFHSDNTTVLDFSTRIESEGNNGNVLKLPTTSGTLALTTDAASSITITLDTVSDATYPLIWTSARSTDTSSGKLYKSFSDLTYHPKLKTVSTTYFKGALLTCIPGARTNSLVYTSGAITIGSALGNAFEGSSPNYELLSYPKDSTAVNSGTSANIMNLRFIWGTSHWHDIFMSPNNLRLYHRYNSNTMTGKSWARIVEESSSEIWNIIADNSTKLGGISASKYVHRELLANNYSYDANTLNTDCVIYTSTGDLLGKAPTWNNFPRTTLPQGGFSLFTIYEGGYGRQLFGEYNDPHLYVRCQIYDSTTGKPGWIKSWETIALLSDPAPSLKSTTIIKDKQFSLSNTLWIDVTDADNKIYTFTDLISGTYAVQITCGNLVASGIMSVCKNITDTALDEIPLHVYHDSSLPWRPYLRTSGNKLLISSNDAAATSRKVTIKIALIL